MTVPDVESIYPLSPQVEGMLLESVSDTGDSPFIEQFAHDLRGTLDRVLFERAWQSTVDRHAALRTAFVWRDQAKPVQAVLRRVSARVDWHQWTGASRQEIDRRTSGLMLAERRRGFDVGRPPLTRLSVVRLGRAAHRLVWTQHHLVIDGWSLPILLRELAATYAAIRDGRAVALPPPVAYAAYAEWLGRQDASAAERYWRGELAGVTGPTPLGRPAAASQGEGTGHGSQEIALGRPLSARLAVLARAHRVTASTLVTGLWAALLGRYATTDDVVLGTTLSGRPAELDGVERMVGMFTTTLPLRLRIEPERSFWEWLTTVQARHLDVRRFEHCSAGQVHEWSGVAASVPLIESVLVFENYPTPGGDGDSGSTFAGARTPYPLALLVLAAGELRLVAVHDERRLARDGVRERLEHVRRLATAAADSPDVTVAALQAEIADRDVPPGVMPVDTRADVAFVAPGSGLERDLAALLGELLGVHGVGLDDDFFELGGHSLAATQFVGRVRRAYDIELPLRVLFEARTVRRLAAAIEGAVIHEIEVTA